MFNNKIEKGGGGGEKEKKKKKGEIFCIKIKNKKIK